MATVMRGGKMSNQSIIKQQISVPDEKEIESILKSIQPVPGVGFYKRMKLAPWQSNPSQKENLHMKTISWKAIAILAIALLLGIALFTPQGRAFAADILQLFNRANTDELSAGTQNQVTNPEPPRNQEVGDIEELAGFDILEPTVLPEGLSFFGASYDPTTQTIVQQFGRSAEEIVLSIRQQPYTTPEACTLCGLVGASAPVEAAPIGTVTGEYVEGVWNLTDNGPVWENTPYLKTLRWQSNGMAFEMIYGSEEVTKQNLIDIALSMK
jgi:hypothetical protein